MSHAIKSYVITSKKACIDPAIHVQLTHGFCTSNIPNKSENATLQLSIFYEKVLDKKYLLKLNNVAQTSSK